ncbi:hypothetical protein KBTX_02319 [wastewater metagenome]|uniref:Type VI secretion system baseplate subunit TssG n=2 Tax=unclassified sequences TaxID=12908 RepID=A0A5B8RB23_9ZZZZ|nr:MULTISPECIES: type VI secretion system baseplate subunit TssG [Arhodomonas]QEA05990.1 hypothetical protein KBTEX_02319 [uncultured organism]
MAPENRHTAPGLIDQARAEPWRFGFFQLVRLLRLHYSRSGRIDPENRPHDDPLRFRSLLSLRFPPSEVSELRFEEGHAHAPGGDALTELQVTFMGLVGPSGVLPRPYTEMLINRHVDSRDDAAHAFFDVFSHRMIALFYQAWQKYRFHIEYERRGSSDLESGLHHLQGLTPTTLRQLNDGGRPGRIERDLFSHFAGLWSQRPRNGHNLEAIVANATGARCRVTPFSGRWLTLDPAQYTRLGQRNARLGKSAVAGTRVRDHQSRFTVSLGPLDEDGYRALLPGTGRHERLKRIIRLFAGPGLDFEIELILGRDHLPRPRLGRSGGLSLGWLGWLKRNDGPAADHGRAVFEITYDGASV